MRLLIRLKALKRVYYNLAYHKDLQGLIYKFLRNSTFKTLHDKKGYKYFSFSNIIPPSRIIEEGSSKSLIVASPDRGLIETVSNGLEEMRCGEVRIGEMAFKIEETRIFDQDLPQEAFKGFTLTSGTPIVIRIPQNRLQEYGITPKHPYRYVYWRKEHTPTAFMKQLEENLLKKYNDYYDAELEPFQIFERLRFKKQVAVPLRMKGEESTIIGTLWNFHFTPLNGTRRDLLQFGLDAGFGE
ncbi:CRISPR-associated endoribonuclease Cas6, partial [Candidatus Bathyarchaeota archaeon]|nr:CRISPR-associated endoribonuclease Cas6 [Candidatus Bathyarchaeota archaeon]